MKLETSILVKNQQNMRKQDRFLECLRGCRGAKIGVGSVWRALVRMSARQVAQRREPEAPKGPKVEA